MGLGEPLLSDLKNLLGGWDFIALDAKGLSEGVLTSWNSTVVVTNSFYVTSRSVIEVYCKILGYSMSTLNIYGPYIGKWEY
jgi:hypothetical protein